MLNEHVLYHKKKLCHIEVGDFTDFQGIGSDPLYKRFESVKAVQRTCIDECYKGFLAQPVFNAEEDTIDWYADDWNETPRRFTELTGEERERYQRIKDETVNHYRNALLKLEDEDLLIMGGALKYIPDETIFCFDNKVVLVAWGMRYDSNKHLDLGRLMYSVPKVPDPPKQYQVCFDAGGPGVLQGKSVWKLLEGETVTESMVPSVTASEGYRFTGWDSNPVGIEVNGDLLFTAQYERVAPKVKPPVEESLPKYYEVRFLDGGLGKLEGKSLYTVIAGGTVVPAMVPKVKPNRKYKFIGWDYAPLGYVVNGNTTFTARYEKKKCWFAAIWPWLWKILLALLLLLLLILLLRNCHRSPSFKNIYIDCPRVDTTTVLQPCDDVTESGDNQGHIGYHAMGQSSGSFVFEYYTGELFPDEITIYDGKNTSARQIFHYSGITGAEQQYATVHFTSETITVKVVASSNSGTIWEYTVHCPSNR